MSSKAELSPEPPEDSDFIEANLASDETKPKKSDKKAASAPSRKAKASSGSHDSRKGRDVPGAILVNGKFYEPEGDFASQDLDNQYFKGPEKGRGAYASVCVLEPILTIEHRDREFYIAVNFHLETTILGYNTQKSNDREWFFSDVTLQYCSKFDKEKLVMQPVSDPTSSFAVTRGSSITTNGHLGLTGANVPSANVSLGITRSRDLSVEYETKTWSLSAHRVAQSANAPLADRPRSTKEYLYKKIRSNDHPPDHSGRTNRHMSTAESPPLNNIECPRYQWFWVGNQEETEILTPDIRHTVKRHIVVKRVIKDADFPINHVNGSDKSQEISGNGKRLGGSELALQKSVSARRRYRRSREALDNGSQQPKLEDLLNFSFYVHVRVKEKYGRLHRFFAVNSNKSKGSILTPYYVQRFNLGVKAESIPSVDIPAHGRKNTESISAILAQIKEEHSGDYNMLQGQKLQQVKQSIQRQIEWTQSAYRHQAPVVHPQLQPEHRRSQSKRRHEVPEMGAYRGDPIMTFDMPPVRPQTSPRPREDWPVQNGTRLREAAQPALGNIDHDAALEGIERVLPKHKPIQVIDANAGREVREAEKRDDVQQ